MTDAEGAGVGERVLGERVLAQDDKVGILAGDDPAAAGGFPEARLCC